MAFRPLLARSLRRVFAVVAAASVFGVTAAEGAVAVAPVANVVAVEAGRVADLVLLSHGFDAGLRQGMVCRLTRGPAEIAEVLVVDLRPNCSAALILSVASKQAIRAGDVAAIKVLKS